MEKSLSPAQSLHLASLAAPATLLQARPLNSLSPSLSITITITNSLLYRHSRSEGETMDHGKSWHLNFLRAPAAVLLCFLALRPLSVVTKSLRVKAGDKHDVSMFFTPPLIAKIENTEMQK